MVRYGAVEPNSAAPHLSNAGKSPPVPAGSLRIPNGADSLAPLFVFYWNSVDHAMRILNHPEVDKQSLKQLYEEHAEAVYRYLLKIFRSEDHAEETLQEVFLRFFKHAQRKNIKNIRSYLFRIGHNLYVDFVADKVKSERLLSSLKPAEDETSFTDTIHWDQLREQMVTFLEGQKNEYAQVFLLRMDHDLTYPEIGYVLNISERTVIRHFENIRNILRAKFGKALGLPGGDQP